MTLRRLLAVAALLPALGACGCEWMKEHGIGKNIGKDKDRPTGELSRKVGAEQLVGYLNTRADRLQSLTYASVWVTATDRSGALPKPPITLNGDLFAVQPRNFNLVGEGGVIGAKVILGSNDQQFWVYGKVPTVDPMYVYASHADFESGKAKIPGNLPFDPDWVMQALCMAHYPAPAGGADPLGVPVVPGAPAAGGPRVQYEPVKIDDKARTYTLSWRTTTPNGVAVVKEIVFDGDLAEDNRPQVKRHVVKDAKSGKVICFADVKAVKTVPSGLTDPKTGGPLDVQYPTKVLLRWEEQKFDLELEVRSAKVNQPLTAEESNRRFRRPNIPGATAVDLADYRGPAPK